MKKIYQKLNDSHKKIIISILLFLILLSGLAVRGDYGVYCDYDSETPIIFMNIKAYAELVLGDDSGYVRGLGDRDVTTDIERDHGAAALYLLIPLSMIPSLRNNPHTWMMTVRAVIYLMFWISLICLYLLTLKMTGKRLLGMLSVLFLWLTPRFFAEGTYNNKDAMALACTLMLMYAGYNFLFDKKHPAIWTALFAFTAALSTNMRITGIILYGIIGLAFIFITISRKDVSVKKALKGFSALLLMPVFYIMLTPATWHGNLLPFISYLTEQSEDFRRTEVYMLMGGGLYDSVLFPPGPAYIYKYISISTPPVILILSLTGVITSIACIKKIKQDSAVYRLTLIAYFVIIAAIIVITKPALYNGWRHMYFLYAVVVLFAALGVYDISCKNKTFSKAVACAVTLQLTALIGYILLNHPLEFNYYNFLAGTGTESKWDGDYWGVGMKYTLEKISEELGPCIIVATEPKFLEFNYPELTDEERMNLYISGDDWSAFLRSDYIIVNSHIKNCNLKKVDADWSTYGENDAALLLTLDESEPVLTIRSGSQILYEVYANPYK